MSRWEFYHLLLTMMPGWMSQAQEDRNQILEAAAENGVIRNYTAWRQSLKGKRFQIKDATLFNLETPTEKKVPCFPGCMSMLQSLRLQNRAWCLVASELLLVLEQAL